jgi:DNA transformation protein
MTDVPIEQMPGIGPKTAAWLQAADIATEAALRQLGAVSAYRRLKFHDPRGVSLNALLSLSAALEGVAPGAVDGRAKARLLAALAEVDEPSGGTRSPSRDSARDRRPSFRAP